MLSKNTSQFLNEFEGLCKKHRISMYACSCCDGVHIESLEDAIKDGSDPDEELDNLMEQLRKNLVADAKEREQDERMAEAEKARKHN